MAFLNYFYSKNKIIFVFIGIIIFSWGFSQRAKFVADSLETKLIQFKKRDTLRAEVLIRLATAIYNNGDLQRCLDLVNEAEFIADSLIFKRGQFLYELFYGLHYSQRGDYTKALEYDLAALKIAEELKSKPDMVRLYRNIGTIYHGIRDYKEALRFYFEGLRTAKKEGMKNDIAGLESNIGIVYHMQKEFDKALEFYELSLKTCEENKNKRTKSYVLNSIGKLHHERAQISQQQRDFDLAIKYFKLSLTIKKELKDLKGMSNALGNIGEVYTDLKSYKQALDFFKQGEVLALETNYKDWLREGYSGMATVYNFMSDYKNALLYYKKFMQVKDTLDEIATKERMTKMQGTFDTDKKDKEILLLQKDNELKHVKLGQQNVLLISVIIGLIIVFIFSIIIFRSYRTKKKSNDMLSRQNHIIESHKQQLEIQKKSVTDSINYARKIQNSVFPDLNYIREFFPGTFVCYKPKDIVSGDFYWFMHKNDFSFYAVADCTGHGVPGAFMSLVASSLLNEIVNDQFTSSPSQILSKLHNLVYGTFKQEKGDEYAQDGLDIALVVYDHKKNKLVFSGARNSVIMIRNGMAEMVHATQKSIGGLSIINTPEPDRKFDEIEIVLNKGDLLLMITDGVLDMFNHKKEKYGILRLKGLSQLLWKKEDPKEMEELGNKEIKQWLLNEIQVDDILMSGIKF